MWTNKLPELMHPASDFYPFNASTADDFRVLAALDMDGADMLTDTKWAAGLFVWRDWVNANGGLCLNASSYQYDHKPGGCKTGQGKKVRVVVFDMRHGGTYAQAKPLMQNFFGTHCVHPSTVKPHLFVLPYGGTVVEDIGSYITSTMKDLYAAVTTATGAPTEAQIKQTGCGIPVVSAGASSWHR